MADPHNSVAVQSFGQKNGWCLHFYRCRAGLWINGVELPILPGYASILPAGAAWEHQFHDRSVYLYAHFMWSAPCPGAVTIPAVQDLDDDFDRLCQAFEGAMSSFERQQRRTEVRIWDILWELTDGGRAHSLQAPQLHREVQKALRIIDERLDEPICIAALAKEIGISHSHLTRLFQGAFKTTVIGYIRERRVQRAKHLLIHSTMPIKSIAAAVGIGDLHLFNKTIHRELGHSPRHLRQNTTADYEGHE